MVDISKAALLARIEERRAEYLASHQLDAQTAASLDRDYAAILALPDDVCDECDGTGIDHAYPATDGREVLACDYCEGSGKGPEPGSLRYRERLAAFSH